MASTYKTDILPSATLDGIDLKNLVRDFSLLKAEVTAIQAKLEVSERVVAELRTEVAALQNKPVTSISPQSARNVTVRRGAKNDRNSPVSIFNADNTDAQVNDRPGQMTSAPPAPKPTPVPVAPSTAPRVLKQKKSYAQAFRQPLPKPRQVSTAEENCVVAPKGYRARKVDVDGFTLVEKRRPKPSRNQRGTAAATATEVTLRVVEPTVSLYISRLDSNTTGEEVLEYLQQRVCFWTRESIRLNLRRLESTRDTTFKSYVLQVPVKHKAMFFSPDFWPAGVVYRRFREAFTKKIPD